LLSNQKKNADHSPLSTAPAVSRIHCLRFPRQGILMSRPTGACPHAWRHQQQPHRGRMWASSPAFRRQLVLLRSLLPSPPCPSSVAGFPQSCPSCSSFLRVRTNHAMAASAGTVYEADAEAVVRRITPPLDRARHKGQAGQYSVPPPRIFVSSQALLCVPVCFLR